MLQQQTQPNFQLNPPLQKPTNNRLTTTEITPNHEIRPS